MAGYSAIRDAVASLAALLKSHITDSGEAGLSGVSILLMSPREAEIANKATGVAVWLHRTEVQADLVNQRAPRPDPDHELHRPLPVDLVIDVVPLHGDAATAQLLLGRVFQVLNDHRRWTGTMLAGDLAASGTVLTVALEFPTLYDLNLLWSGQQTHVRPGVALRLTGLSIDTHLDARTSSRVLSAKAGLAQRAD